VRAAVALAAAGMASISGGAPAQPPTRPIDIAMRDIGDEQVALVAVLLADEPSWVGLYKILDAVEDAVGGEHVLEQKGWVPADDLKRLTLTANAIETATHGGRHAKRKSSLARSKLAPMTLDEAWRTTKALVRAWLLDRA
jgi:hypothetical protein